VGKCDPIGMNSETLFSMALGLQSPWQVQEITFAPNESGHEELHLSIGFMDRNL